jgi:hypothetical protein
MSGYPKHYDCGHYRGNRPCMPWPHFCPPCEARYARNPVLRTIMLCVAILLVLLFATVK